MTCGKRTYDNGSDAVASANKIVKKHGGSLRPYVCNKCGKWHLTSQVRCHRNITSLNFIKGLKSG